jgi:uncharacterized protein (DUF305 family)
MIRPFAGRAAAVLAIALSVAAASAVLAQMPHGSHGSHGTPPRADDSPSTRAYKAANDRMHKDMNIAFTGNADRDVAAGMIPHHQGAIDMARTVLQYGKDPELRKLAEEIVAAQEKEIAQLRAWLARAPR